MQVEEYHSDDYAGLESGNLKFYFGYEEIDEKTEEWCFVAKKDNKEILRIPQSELNKKCKNMLDMPQDYLIFGIGIYLLLK